MATRSIYPPVVTSRERERYAAEIQRTGVIEVAHGISVRVVPAEGVENAFVCRAIAFGRAVEDEKADSLMNTRLRAIARAVEIRTQGANPLHRSWIEMKAAFPGTLVGARLGDFYEFFFDDAETVSQFLGLTLTSRNEIPMAGVPAHAIDANAKALAEAGLRAAFVTRTAAGEPWRAERLIEPSTEGILRRIEDSGGQAEDLAAYRRAQTEQDDAEANGALASVIPHLVREGEASLRPLTRQEASALNEALLTTWERELWPDGSQKFTGGDWPITAAGMRPTALQAAALTANFPTGHRPELSAWSKFAGKPVPVQSTGRTVLPIKETPAPAPEVVAAVNVPQSITSINELVAVADLIFEGALPAAAIKQGWASFRANRTRIQEQLAAEPKNRLIRWAGMSARLTDKKEALVRSALHMMEMAFASGAVSYVTSFGKREDQDRPWLDAVEQSVEKWTDEMVAATALKRREEAAARQQAKDADAAAIANPQTVEDWDKLVMARGRSGPISDAEKAEWAALKKITSYAGIDARRNYVKQRGERKLTPEELARYDAVRGIDRQAALEKAAVDKRAVIEGVDALAKVGLTVSKHFHDKRNADVWIVQLGEKVDTAAFKDLAAKARRLGGNYVRAWKPTNAPAGFQFPSETAAEQFMSLREGDVSRIEEVQAERAERRENAVERLRLLAGRMIEDADSTLSADRKTNTHRRASMAAAMEGRARGQKAMATTIANLASAIESGAATHLKNIRNRAQVETLDGFAKDAKRAAEGSLSHPERERLQDEPPKPEQMVHARYPQFSLVRSIAVSLGQALSQINGTKRLGEKILRRASHLGEDDDLYLEADDASEVMEKMGKRAPWQITATMGRWKHLQQLGIADLPSLRAALREYVQHREGVRAADPIKEAERALIGRKIAGFFPTPASVIERMLDAAEVEEGMRVLEPSAGKGDIAEALVERGADVDVIECNSSLRAILEMKGFKPIESDFLCFHPKADERYDRVVMNPPFEKGADIAHVRHAFGMLKPGGRIVAIMSEGPFSREDKQASSFREWLTAVEGESERLEQGSFAGSDAFRQTGVATRIVVLSKGETLSQAEAEETSSETNESATDDRPTTTDLASTTPPAPTTANAGTDQEDETSQSIALGDSAARIQITSTETPTIAPRVAPRVPPELLTPAESRAMSLRYEQIHAEAEAECPIPRDSADRHAQLELEKGKLRKVERRYWGRMPEPHQVQELERARAKVATVEAQVAAQRERLHSVHREAARRILTEFPFLGSPRAEFPFYVGNAYHSAALGVHHQTTVMNAIRGGRAVSAEAVEEYGLEVPANYRRVGAFYCAAGKESELDGLTIYGSGPDLLAAADSPNAVVPLELMSPYERERLRGEYKARALDTEGSKELHDVLKTLAERPDDARLRAAVSTWIEVDPIRVHIALAVSVPLGGAFEMKGPARKAFDFVQRALVGLVPREWPSSVLAGRHSYEVMEAMQLLTDPVKQRPVSALAVDAYGLGVPTGYERVGGRFEFTGGLSQETQRAPALGDPLSYRRWQETAESEQEKFGREIWTSVTGAPSRIECLMVHELKAAIAAGKSIPSSARHWTGKQLLEILEKRRENIAGEEDSSQVPLVVETTHATRESVVERICAAVRARVDEPFEIAEVVSLLGSDGKWHSPFGFPIGVSSTGERRIEGYARVTKEGTTVGLRHESAAAVRDRARELVEQQVAKARVNFSKMGAKRLLEAAQYWLKHEAPVRLKPEKALNLALMTPAEAEEVPTYRFGEGLTSAQAWKIVERLGLTKENCEEEFQPEYLEIVGDEMRMKGRGWEFARALQCVHAADAFERLEPVSAKLVKGWHVDLPAGYGIEGEHCVFRWERLSPAGFREVFAKHPERAKALVIVVPSRRRDVRRPRLVA